MSKIKTIFYHRRVKKKENAKILYQLNRKTSKKIKKSHNSKDKCKIRIENNFQATCTSDHEHSFISIEKKNLEVNKFLVHLQ